MLGQPAFRPNRRVGHYAGVRRGVDVAATVIRFVGLTIVVVLVGLFLVAAAVAPLRRRLAAAGSR